MKLGKMGNILCNCVSSSLLIPRLIPVKLLTKQCVTWSDMEQSNNDKVNDDYDKDDGDGDSDDIDDDDVWLNRWVAWPKVTLRRGEKNLGSVGALVKPALLWDSPFLRYEIERGLRAVYLRANFSPSPFACEQVMMLRMRERESNEKDDDDNLAQVFSLTFPPLHLSHLRAKDKSASNFSFLHLLWTSFSLPHCEHFFALWS